MAQQPVAGDMMVYGIINVGGRLVAALRLRANHLRRKITRPGLYLLPWMIRIADVEAFGFTRFRWGKVYTSRADDTVMVEANKR